MQQDILHTYATLQLPVLSTSLRTSSLHNGRPQESFSHIFTPPAPTTNQPPKPPIVAPKITTVLEKKREATPIIPTHRSASPVPTGYAALNNFNYPVPSHLLIG